MLYAFKVQIGYIFSLKFYYYLHCKVSSIPHFLSKFIVMKSILATAFSLIILSSCTPVIYGEKAEPALRSYESIMEFPLTSKDELFVKANSWFVEQFVSAESVIEYSDKDAGKIMGKYVCSFKDGIYYFQARSTISIDVKDSKVRLIISDPYYKAVGDDLNGMYNDFREYTILETKTGVEMVRLEWYKLEANLKTRLLESDEW